MSIPTIASPNIPAIVPAPSDTNAESAQSNAQQGLSSPFTIGFSKEALPWVVAAVSLGIVAIVATLLSVGFCLGRRYCCKAPSVVLNTPNPLPLWHRAWKTVGVHRRCGGPRSATSNAYCSRHA